MGKPKIKVWGEQRVDQEKRFGTEKKAGGKKKVFERKDSKKKKQRKEKVNCIRADGECTRKGGKKGRGRT